MEALEMTLLFDYYGELLTEKQRNCVDMRYNQDMSLGEIAQELGISRQGVYDNLNRAEGLLRNMEQKTGFVRRDARVRLLAQEILAAAQQLQTGSGEDIGNVAARIVAAARELEE